MDKPRDEAICGHLIVAQVSLKESKLKAGAMIERMDKMAGETKWRGDIDGTREMLEGMLCELKKLTGAQAVAAPGQFAKVAGGSKLGLLPGVPGAIDQIRKAIKLC
jgi:hypothetical protein